MPIIKSAIKRARQSIKRQRRNVGVKQAVKLDSKAVIAAVATDLKSADTALRAAVSEIDRAVKKGTLHKNTAARRKSRLAKLVNAAQSPDAAKATAAVKATKKPTVRKSAAKTTAKKSPAKK